MLSAYFDHSLIKKNIHSVNINICKVPVNGEYFHLSLFKKVTEHYHPNCVIKLDYSIVYMLRQYFPFYLYYI